MNWEGDLYEFLNTLEIVGFKENTGLMYKQRSKYVLGR